ncbi:hypothetical protein COY23_02825 [bacterium (Candidatus Torokbacteria) CG_4_10_14_0_2_um_filter_35_8]|nr:MAG: hypothetical protein COY23_02825 [bacterium (Candidatus Torokbacteria) CG_4_10_14_0_2_um_filter_35_8]
MSILKAKLNNVFENLFTFLVLFLIPASIFRSNASFPDYPSLFLFRIITGLILGLFLIWFLIDSREVQKKFKKLFSIKYYLLFFVFWFTLSLVSYFWSADKYSNIRYNVFFLFWMILIFSLPLFVGKSTKRLKIIYKFFFLALVIVLVMCFFEMFFRLRMPESKLFFTPRRFQWAVTSFFYNPNNFATYLSLSLPFLLLLPIWLEKRSLRALNFALILLLILSYSFTNSQVNRIILGLETIVCTYFLIQHKIKDIFTYIGIGFVVLFLSVSYLGLDIKYYFFPEEGLEYEYLEEQSDLGLMLDTAYAGGGSIHTRIQLARNAFQELKDPKTFLIGVGSGNAENRISYYVNTEGKLSMHNFWVEIALLWGIPFFILYSVFYLFLLRGLYKILQNAKSVFRKENSSDLASDKFFYYLTMSFLISMLGFIIGSISPSSAFVFAPTWLYFGFCLAWINLINSKFTTQGGSA